MATISNESLRLLRDVLKEPNEFKRYTLLQLWISQLFTSTIIDPIKSHENRIKDISHNITGSIPSLYDVLRDIKSNLTSKNEELTAVLHKMNNQLDILMVLNVTLGLEQDTSIEQYRDNIKRVKDIIQSNRNYIERIENLSETKIATIINERDTDK